MIWKSLAQRRLASWAPGPGRRGVDRRALLSQTWVAAALLWLWVPDLALAADRAQQRADYRQARSALARGQTGRFEQALARLSDYPLRPYLEAAAMTRDLDRVGGDAVRDFVARHPELPPARRLLSRYLSHLAREKRWAEFRRHYLPQSSIKLRCHALHAEILAGQPVPLNEPHQDLWLYGGSRPDACNPVFAHWRKRGLLDANWHWRRAVLAVEAGDLRLATWLGRVLDAKRRDNLERWMDLRRSPESELTRARHWSDTAVNRRMLAFELRRMAGDRADAAAHHWADLAPHFSWEDDQRIAIARRITLMRATDYPDDALAALHALPAVARDLQIREWTVRVALHRGDWRAVLSALDDLPAEDQARERWRYWRARSLAALGRVADADALYRALAREANYYGFLAADRIGQPYALCPQLRSVAVEDLAPVTGNAFFERAIELFHAGQLTDARREFRLATRPMDSSQRRVAAVLANAEGWHDQAILTLADAGYLRQYALRFPLAWADRVAREAARRRVNPSFVFAVMRSESAMAPDAVSSAQARGLMQLTEATGRQVARRYTLPLPRRADLIDPDRNITLGTAYLDQLFQRFEHPLMVLAGYNAGPEAVERWQSMGMPVDADRWIETVPYHETREYLSRVLAFATIYDWRRLGRIVPIGVRMPALNQRPGRSDLNARPSVRVVCPLPASAARAG